MAATITVEMMVGITPKIQEALEIACEDVGMRPSQFARQAIVEKLVKEGFMTRPHFRARLNSPAPELKAAE